MIKYINIAVYALVSINLLTQDLDESFLESVPNDIRKDVVERSARKAEDNQDKYKSFQYSSKLEQFEELSKLKERIESDLLELEKRLSSDEELSIKEVKLELFGSEFFNTFQTSFMPINEPNPDASYTLDVGDILNIQLIGQKSIHDR